MSILKLQNAGDKTVLHVTRCEVVEGQYGEQVMFESGDDTLYLPRSSADRQLERIGFGQEGAIAYDATVGEALEFSRTPSNKAGGKPFWNINTVKKNGAPPKPSAPKTQLPQARSYGTPDFLPTEGEEQAELGDKIGPDLRRAEAVSAKQRIYSAAMKQAVSYTLNEIEPLYRKANIGLTGDEAYKHAFSIYATWCDKGLVE